MESRTRFIGEIIVGGRSMTELCAAFGVSRKTGYKRLRRYHREGPVGLRGRSLAAVSARQLLWVAAAKVVLSVVHVGQGIRVAVDDIVRVPVRTRIRHQVEPQPAASWCGQSGQEGQSRSKTRDLGGFHGFHLALLEIGSAMPGRALPDLSSTIRAFSKEEADQVVLLPLSDASCAD